jgi:hypothetical protein
MWRYAWFLILSSFGLPLFPYAQTGSPVSRAAYEDFMGDRNPVRLLLERDGSTVRALLLDLNREQLMAMEGQWEGDEMQLTAALLRSEPTLEDAMEGFILKKHSRAGQFQAKLKDDGTLAGKWTAIGRSANIPGSAGFQLIRRKIPLAASPFQLRRLLYQDGMSSAKFQFTLAEQLTGVDFRALYYFDEGGEPRQLGPDKLRADILDRNLLGDETEESLLVLTFGNGLYLLAPFTKAAEQWTYLGDHLLVRKPEPHSGPCRTEAPGKGYFFFNFAEIFRAGEYALVGRTFGGQCRGVSRSDDIRFYIWRVQEDGIKRIYEDQQVRFVYEFPDPKAVEPAVANEFSFAEGARSAFPKRLKKVALQLPPDANDLKAARANTKPEVTFIDLQ